MIQDITPAYVGSVSAEGRTRAESCKPSQQAYKMTYFFGTVMSSLYLLPPVIDALETKMYIGTERVQYS
jgi:hypothetical protein